MIKRNYIPNRKLCCRFVFFKLQSDVFLLLPSDNEFYDAGNEYFFFELSFRALFWCQTVYLIYTIIQQCQSDIFFIDWERARGKGGINNGVSMWRSVLIANEWNRMQTKRKNSVEFSLILVGFFMIGLGQRRNAMPQLNYNHTKSENINIALNYANSVIFWSIASISQWLWRFLLYERYIAEPPSMRFIDLCTGMFFSFILFCFDTGTKSNSRLF